jgi:hypothetical protein
MRGIGGPVVVARGGGGGGGDGRAAELLQETQLDGRAEGAFWGCSWWVGWVVGGALLSVKGRYLLSHKVQLKVVF